MGRIFSTRHTSTDRHTQLDASSSHHIASSAHTGHNTTTVAEEIDMIRTSLRQMDQLIDQLDRSIIATNDAEGFADLYAEAVSFRQQIRDDLRRRLNGEDPIHYSDSSDYAERLNSILHDDRADRRGYQPTAIPFDFSQLSLSDGQSFHHHDASDGD